MTIEKPRPVLFSRVRSVSQNLAAPIPQAPPGPQPLFDQAVRLHREGRLPEAERLYRQVLALDPRHAEAIHMLGGMACQVGRYDAAVELIGTAIALDGSVAIYHCNLGVALLELGRCDEAVAAYQTALRLVPDYPEAWSNLGNALRHGGRLKEAAEALRQAIRLRPGLAEAHTNLGATLVQLGACEEGVAALREAVRLKPELTEALANLGAALLKLGQYDETETVCREVLRRVPDRAQTHAILAAALGALQRDEEAVRAYREAVRLKPDFAAAHSALGATLVRLGQRAEAEAACREAVRLAPDFADAHFNLGMILLARGEMVEGWAEHEWRWQTEQMRAARRVFAQPQWRGEEARGKTVLIHAEQGLGDTLQFCRYVPLLVARGMRVVLGVPGPLVRLVSCLPAVVADSTRGLPPFDLHCPMLSLPPAMGTTLATVPAHTPYLRADPGLEAAWQDRIAALPGGLPRELRVGLVWAGNPRLDVPGAAQTDRRRSIPSEGLAPLMRVPGVRFFSLQKDGPAAPEAFGLIDFMGEMHDFADTAALVAQLDLVISVDTSVLHLAGALGRPVWLLDRFDHCWRWIAGRRDSPWYPNLRIYRQPRPGAWEPVIAEAARDLRELARPGGC